MTKKKPSIIFAGSADFACPSLEALADFATIELVLTQPQKPAGRGLTEQSCPLDICATKLNLPIMRPSSLKDPAVIDVLTAIDFDYLIVVAYGKIIPKWLLSLPKKDSLNVHGSLLPRWRGAAPVQQALLAGDHVTGVGIMRMTAGLDEGPVFLEKKLVIEHNDDQETLTQKLSIIGAKALIEVLDSLPFEPIEQKGEITYAHKIVKEMGLINLEKPTQTLINQYRALKGWPGLYLFLRNGKRVKINKISLTPGPLFSKDPGSLVLADRKVFLATCDASLELLEVQLEGQKNIEISAVLSQPNHWMLKETQLYTDCSQ